MPDYSRKFGGKKRTRDAIAAAPVSRHTPYKQPLSRMFAVYDALEWAVSQKGVLCRDKRLVIRVKDRLAKRIEERLNERIN